MRDRKTPPAALETAPIAARPRWRIALALAVSPMILSPLLLYTGVTDTIEGVISPVRAFGTQVAAMAPNMYGFCAICGLIVLLAGRLWPWARLAWVVIPMFALTGGVIVAAIGWREHDTLLQGAAMSALLAPVAIAYCLIAGVGWRRPPKTSGA